MTALLLEISIFCVRGGCKILMARYTSKCASQFLSNKPFLHNFMCLAHKIMCVRFVPIRMYYFVYTSHISADGSHAKQHVLPTISNKVVHTQRQVLCQPPPDLACHALLKHARMHTAVKSIQMRENCTKSTFQR